MNLLKLIFLPAMLAVAQRPLPYAQAPGPEANAQAHQVYGVVAPASAPVSAPAPGPMAYALAPGPMASAEAPEPMPYTFAEAPGPMPYGYGYASKPVPQLYGPAPYAYAYAPMPYAAHPACKVQVQLSKPWNQTNDTTGFVVYLKASAIGGTIHVPYDISINAPGYNITQAWNMDVTSSNNETVKGKVKATWAALRPTSVVDLGFVTTVHGNDSSAPTAIKVNGHACSIS